MSRSRHLGMLRRRLRYLRDVLIPQAQADSTGQRWLRRERDALEWALRELCPDGSEATDSQAQPSEQFTLDQLRTESDRVARAARSPGGCIVVNGNGDRVGSLWIPQDSSGRMKGQP